MEIFSENSFFTDAGCENMWYTVLVLMEQRYKKREKTNFRRRSEKNPGGKIMKKRLLGLLLCVVLLAGLLPAAVSAAETTELSVGSFYTNRATRPLSDSSEGWSFTPASEDGRAKLVLDGYRKGDIRATFPMDIEVKSDSTITLTETRPYCAIKIFGACVLSGAGDLTITTVHGDSVGIFTSGDLTVAMRGDLDVTASAARGINAYRNLILSGRGNVTVRSKEEGLLATRGSVVLSGRGNVDVASTERAAVATMIGADGYALYVNGTGHELKFAAGEGHKAIENVSSNTSYDNRLVMGSRLTDYDVAGAPDERIATYTRKAGLPGETGTLVIRAIFTGISENEIPSGLTFTVNGPDGFAPVTKAIGEFSGDRLTRELVMVVPEGNYIVTEGGAGLPGYTLSAAYRQGEEDLPMDNGAAAAVAADSRTEAVITNAYTLNGGADPQPNDKTVEIPFAVDVRLGGNVAAPEQSFELEIFEIGNSNAEDYRDVAISASLKTNGAGKYEGTIGITGPEDQVDALTQEGFLVREKDAQAESWECDTAVWAVRPNRETDEGFAVYPVTQEKTDNGTFYLDGEEPVEKMVFANTYTKNEDALPPKTGDSGIVLWGALLALSLGCGALVLCRRKKNCAD